MAVVNTELEGIEREDLFYRSNEYDGTYSHSDEEIIDLQGQALMLGDEEQVNNTNTEEYATEIEEIPSSDPIEEVRGLYEDEWVSHTMDRHCNSTPDWHHSTPKSNGPTALPPSSHQVKMSPHINPALHHVHDTEITLPDTS